MQGLALLQTTRTSLSDRDRTRLIYLVSLLTVASALFSFVFACAIPFAALVTFAALKLRRRDAVFSIGAVWLTNQAVGYGCLNYPRTLDSLAWGIALGVAAYAALIAAMQIAGRFQKIGGLMATGLTFVAAFATFKMLLFGASLAIGGGSIAISWLAFEKALSINIIALPVLFILHYLGPTIRPLGRPVMLDERTRAWFEQEQDRAITL